MLCKELCEECDRYVSKRWGSNSLTPTMYDPSNYPCAWWCGQKIVQQSDLPPETCPLPLEHLLVTNI